MLPREVDDRLERWAEDLCRAHGCSRELLAAVCMEVANEDEEPGPEWDDPDTFPTFPPPSEAEVRRGDVLDLLRDRLGGHSGLAGMFLEQMDDEEVMSQTPEVLAVAVEAMVEAGVDFDADDLDEQGMPEHVTIIPRLRFQDALTVTRSMMSTVLPRSRVLIATSWRPRARTRRSVRAGAGRRRTLARRSSDGEPHHRDVAGGRL